MQQRIKDLEGKEPSPEDDKYALTKKKLVSFMKSQGWYD